MAKFKININNPDWDSIAKEIAKKYHFGFREGFRNKGGMTDASEGGWAELKRPRASGRNLGKILVDTGQLYKSIRIQEANAKRIRIVSDIFYGVFHNEGSKIHPQREFMGDSRRIEMRVVRMLKKEIKKQILKA